MLREMFKLIRCIEEKGAHRLHWWVTDAKADPSITQGPDIAQQPVIKMADEISHKLLPVFYLEVRKSKLASKKISSKVLLPVEIVRKERENNDYNV